MRLPRRQLIATMNEMKLLILADNGGSNGPRCRAWKYQLQVTLCDRHKLR